MGELLNKKESAEFLGMAVNTFNKLVKDGVIEPIIQDGKTFRFDADDLTKHQKKGKNPIITVNNQKGGVLKTTTALSIALNKSREGKKVLLCDLDPQGSLSESFLRDYAEMEENSIKKVLDGSRSIKQCVIDITPTLSFIPADMGLSSAVVTLASSGEISRFLLADILDSVRHEYDMIILDTPPNQPFISNMCLSAATMVIIPTPKSDWAKNGAGLVIDSIKKYKRDKRTKSEIEKVLILPNSTNRKNRIFFKDKDFENYLGELDMLFNSDLVSVSKISIPMIDNAEDIENISRDNIENFQHEIFEVYKKIMKSEEI